MFQRSRVLLLLLPLFFLACSSGSDKKFDEVVTIRQGDPVAQILSWELVAGENRFSFFVLNGEQVPVVDATTKVTFYDLSDGKEVKKQTVEAASLVPARDAGLTEQVIHTHADGSRHVHINAGDEIGIYAVNVAFDRPGTWGAEIEVEGGKPALSKTMRLRFDVLDKGAVPNVGDKAPPSDNLTAADVTDLAIIDTSTEPSADMHTMSIADAVATGKPTLVLFAAPGYCTSRICGPEYEIMKKLYKERKDESVNYVHVEFYSDPSTPQKTPVRAAREWNLPTEPWFFLIDGKGTIVARFEGPTGLNELEEALKKVGL